MNKLMILLLYFVYISGFALKFELNQLKQIILWLHVILSFFFSAIVIVFLIDHVYKYKKQLFQFKKPAMIGLLYQSWTIMALISGVILLLYYPNNQNFWLQLHFIVSSLTVAHSLIHK